MDKDLCYEDFSSLLFDTDLDMIFDVWPVPSF